MHYVSFRERERERKNLAIFFLNKSLRENEKLCNYLIA